MSIESISHITFIVKDSQRMARFIGDGLGGREVYDSRSISYTPS